MPARYSRKEVATLTGVSEHLIHKYIKMGLLPGCIEGRNRWCLYGQEHVNRVRLIQDLHDPDRITLVELKTKLESHPERYPFK